MYPTDATVLSARLAFPRPLDRPPLSVVVPLFDETANLPTLYRRLTDTLTAHGEPFELVFVNDGSRDGTGRMLDLLAAADPRLTVVHFSRNFGHQAAVTAGLNHARGDAVVVMDGDLQDPPELLPRLVERWRAGAEVVYAVRTKRKEGPLKRAGYFVFYRLLRAAADLDVPLDAGDFCLMDRRAVDALNRLPEKGRFVRGLRSFVGFRQVGLTYERDPRAAGESKYTLGKLAALAADGLFDFSRLPLRALFHLSLALELAAVLVLLLGGSAVAAAVCGVGGVLLFGQAVVGEYVRRIFVEVKGRPAYIVREVVRRAAPREAAG